MELVRAVKSVVQVALYADDTEIHANSKDINQAESDVNDDVKSVSIWFTKNVSVFICNRKKTEAMPIGVVSVFS